MLNGLLELLPLPIMDSTKSYIDSLPPKVAFIGGVVTTLLALGTVGFIVLGSCLLSGKCALGSSSPAAQPLAAAQQPLKAQPSLGEPAAGPIPDITTADHVRGDKNAPVTIVEFSDFQCPFCERFHPTMLKVMTDYKGKVRWVFRHYPLSFHPNAQPAAIASECAGQQGKFWEFADAMFAGQSANLTSDSATAETFYTKTATSLGLNTTKFDQCRKDPKELAAVQADEQGGVTAGVNGTPGSFVIAKNGTVQPIRGALPYEAVKTMIDAALK